MMGKKTPVQIGFIYEEVTDTGKDGVLKWSTSLLQYRQALEKIILIVNSNTSTPVLETHYILYNTLYKKLV